MERSYRNLGYVLLALVPIFVAGFWVPYISEFPHFDSAITTAVHIHSVLLFSFLGLLIVQPLAIRHKAFSVHRVLGKFANILMPFILLLSAAMLWKEYQEHIATGTPAALAREDEFLSSMQLILLGIFYWRAIACIQKRNIPEHMRYIVCIVLVLLPAGLARTLGYWFDIRQSISQTVCLVVIDFFLVALILLDRYRHTSSRPYTIALMSYICIEIVWFSLGRPV